MKNSIKIYSLIFLFLLVWSMVSGFAFYFIYGAGNVSNETWVNYFYVSIGTYILSLFGFFLKTRRIEFIISSVIIFCILIVFNR
jgi:hypothetical protein